MTRTALKIQRLQTAGEELANSISHGVGLLAALAGLPVLVIAALRRGEAAGVVGAAVFATTMVLLYLSSTVYHALPPRRGRAKAVWRVLDHSAIYLLIAGTYTPFTLGVLRGAWGWVLFGMIWSLAISGVLLKSVAGIRYDTLSTIVYLGMGWLALIALKPLMLQVPTWGLVWLFGGGLAYTAGIPFYASKRLRYSHFVWHLFVLAGTACHFVAVLRYAA